MRGRLAAPALALALCLISVAAYSRARFHHAAHRHLAVALHHHPAHHRRHAARIVAGKEWHGGFGPRPTAWCGWEMRQLVSRDPGPAYNRAAKWAEFGHAGPAGIGAIVVWVHHVSKIVGQELGKWVLKSGNDGNALRTRPRSIDGAIAIRWED